MITRKIGGRRAADVDPNWANVVLAVPMQGGDGSTAFTDVSGRHVLTAAGNAQIDTAQKKFRVSSGLFDGTGDVVSAPDSDDWNFGNGAVTIQTWARFNALPGAGLVAGICGQFHAITAAQQAWTLGILESGGNYLMRLAYNVGAGVVGVNSSTSFALATNTWYHLRWCWDGSFLYPYLDGTLIGSAVAFSPTLRDVAESLGIGATDAAGSSNLLNGWMQDLRIYKGDALSTGASFSVPTDLLPQRGA